MQTTDPGVIRPEERSIAPDLARGVMLLMIAVANVHLYLHGRPVGVRGYPADLTGLDRWVAMVQLAVVDGRAYPMFGLLFGYGIVQMARRHEADGVPGSTTLRLLRRRGLWMIVLGLAHALLLWSGDFLGLYGLIALAAAGLLVRSGTRTLVTLAVVGLVLTTAFYAGSAFPGLPGQVAFLPSVAEPGVLDAATARVVEWATGFVNSIGLFGSVAIGAVAARYGLLDRPAEHRRLLRILTASGIAVALLGGLPIGLLAAGVWTDPTLTERLVAGAVHSASGYAGGIGFAALFGLLALRLRRTGTFTAGLVACGQRSLSCYLAQSVFFVALLPAWTFGGGGIATLAEATLFGIATWLAILGCAAGAERARGPAERVLRRLTHGRASTRERVR